MIGSLRRIRLIAGNTFLEAVRQKFINVLLMISVALLISSGFFQQFDFGTSELKFIIDFGFGALVFFGSILSIAGTAQLFFNEIDSRTALTILAKPVHKLEFLAAKFLGVQMLMLAFILTLSLLLAGILFMREAALVARMDEGFPSGHHIVYGDLFVFGFIQWIKFGVLCSISLFIGSFSNSNLYTMITSFFILIICQLQYIARNAYTDLEGPARWFMQILSLLFPNFQLFNVGDSLVFSENAGLPFVTVLQIVFYGLVYTSAFLLLAQASFKYREI